MIDIIIINIHITNKTHENFKITSINILNKIKHLKINIFKALIKILKIDKSDFWKINFQNKIKYTLKNFRKINKVIIIKIIKIKTYKINQIIRNIHKNIQKNIKINILKTLNKILKINKNYKINTTLIDNK